MKNFLIFLAYGFSGSVLALSSVFLYIKAIETIRYFLAHTPEDWQTIAIISFIGFAIGAFAWLNHNTDSSYDDYGGF